MSQGAQAQLSRAQRILAFAGNKPVNKNIVDMESQTLWDHIDGGLPELLPYNLDHYLAKNGKDSTTWASHSHTPVSISKWDLCF